MDRETREAIATAQVAIKEIGLRLVSLEEQVRELRQLINAPNDQDTTTLLL